LQRLPLNPRHLKANAQMTYTEPHMALVPVMMVEKFSAEQLGKHDSLDLRAMDQKGWETIVSSCNATEVRLYYLKIQSLNGVERLRKTVRLSVEYANKVEDISPLFRMPWLKSLWLYDLPRLRRIDGIEALEDLRELRLSGNRGSMDPPLRLETVRPIAGLRKLEKLELTNIRLEDRDISFIASSFPNLRSLQLSLGEFERAQFAYLAKRLNSKLEEPILSSWELGYMPCRRCGRKRHSFRGRGMPVLCQICDEKRFKKLTEEFQNPMPDAGGALEPPKDGRV